MKNCSREHLQSVIDFHDFLTFSLDDLFEKLVRSLGGLVILRQKESLLKHVSFPKHVLQNTVVFQEQISHLSRA